MNFLSLTNTMINQKFAYYVRTRDGSQCCDFMISKMKGKSLALLLVDTTLKDEVNGKVNNFYQKFINGNANFQSMIA